MLILSGPVAEVYLCNLVSGNMVENSGGSTAMMGITEVKPAQAKLNGTVERTHRAHTEEFYEVTESPFDLSELREELLELEQLYNTVRPHQAPGYVTPLEFLKQRKEHSRKEVMCY